jgi:site-specific DNA-methyltransferase (adenine-specific)
MTSNARTSVAARVFALPRRAEGVRVRSAPFAVVVADPPWPFRDKLPGASRGAKKNYDVLSLDDIRAGRFTGGGNVVAVLDGPNVADDAYLFLWRVSAMVEEACSVVRAWGFVPKSEVVWRKQTVNGKRHFGMGRHVRMEHEVCIVATRGKPKPLSRSVRSVFDAPAPSGPNGRAIHSAKPDAFYRDVVEKLYHGPYLELFARRRLEGWTCVGNEVA